jgi:hypothetical protein
MHRQRGALFDLVVIQNLAKKHQALLYGPIPIPEDREDNQEEPVRNWLIQEALNGIDHGVWILASSRK